jgi:hypothetical protein
MQLFLSQNGSASDLTRPREPGVPVARVIKFFPLPYVSPDFSAPLTGNRPVKIKKVRNTEQHNVYPLNFMITSKPNLKMFILLGYFLSIIIYIFRI